MSAQPPSGKNPSIDGQRFQEMQALLADRAVARRSLGVRHLAVEIASDELDAAGRSFLEGQLKRVACDAELVVRVALATAVRHSNHLPRDVALSLADDTIAVAQPILEESPVLSDRDLLTVLAECDGRKQVCIARRRSISVAVAASVVAAGNAAAVAALVENEGAPLDADILMRIFDRYGRFETVKTAMAGRGDLPAVICQRLHRQASRGAEPAVEQYASDVPSSATPRVQVARLHADGQLTPARVLEALCGGDIRFAEDAMAEIAGVSAEKAGLLIHDASPFGLKAIYRQCGFPEQLFAAFRVAIDMVQDRELDADACKAEAFTDRVVESILAKYRELEAGDLDYVLGQLRRPRAA
jgi:uncharacterized protein (DUF2336 family)